MIEETNQILDEMLKLTPKEAQIGKKPVFEVVEE